MSPTRNPNLLRCAPRRAAPRAFCRGACGAPASSGSTPSACVRRNTEPPFEELRKTWKCPQCAGPRRRFVKKAGGMTAKVDDSGLIIGLGATALLTIGLVYFGLTV